MRSTTVAAALFALLAIVATACASDNQAEPSADNAASNNAASDNAVSDNAGLTAPATTTSTAFPTTSTSLAEPAVASATAESFKIVAPSVAELGPGIAEFIEATDAARIDALATHACSEVTVDLSQSELGLQALDAYERLQSTEQETISAQDWMVFYGSILGYFCPNNFDGSADAADLTDPDAALEQFQAIVSRLGSVSAEADAFAQAMDSAALERLRGTACVVSETDSGTGPDNEAFGAAIIDSYEFDLTDAEREQLTLSGYGELYGAIVGWSCPANLPR